MDAKSAILSSSNSKNEDPEGRINRFRRRQRNPTSPPSVSSDGSTWRRLSPPLRYYDSDEEVIRRLKGKLPSDQQTLYTYVPIEDDKIRLLLLSPGKEDDKIYCSLKTISVSRIQQQKLRYQALSYCWGDEHSTEVIFVQDISVPQPTRKAEDMMILMATQTKPRPFAVRPNLFAALEFLRSKTKDIWLWVDAICINQEDDDEKNHQLPKMPDIYRRAWNVTIWIGACKDQEEDCALDFLPLVLNLKLLDRLVEGNGHDEAVLRSWVRFSSILKRPWFSRRWVVQEVAFGTRLSVRCGNTVVSWLDFADAVELFMRKLGRIRTLYDASDLSRHDPDALNNVESAGAQIMVSTTNSILRKTDEGSILEYAWDLESLVMRLTSFAASDPRDTVFAFCALAKDGHKRSSESESVEDGINEPFIPQYTKKPNEVYMEFAEYCVKTTRSLDIICRHWALPIPYKLGHNKWYNRRFPSWIGLVKDSSFGPPSSFTGRINGDSLVGQPGARIYNASLQMEPIVHFGLQPSPSDGGERSTANEELQLIKSGRKRKRRRSASSENNSELFLSGMPQTSNITTGGDLETPDTPEPNTSGPAIISSEIPRSLNGELHAKGIILQEISRISSRVVDGTISEDCLRILDWTPSEKSFDSIQDRIWRTLVANRGPDGKNPPLWYKRACVYALKKTNHEGDLNTSKLIANKSLPESVLEYLKRVQAIVWSRKFFRCDRSYKPSHSKEFAHGHEDLFGIGSRNIEKGDLVCVLFGCSVPVILRRSEISKDGKTHQVSFLSESYVYGKMDGEALRIRSTHLSEFEMNFVIS